MRYFEECLAPGEADETSIAPNKRNTDRVVNERAEREEYDGEQTPDSEKRGAYGLSGVYRRRQRKSISVRRGGRGRRRGLVDHWLHPIRETSHAHRHELEAIADVRARLDRLCELNVIRQVQNVASDIFVQEAWARGQELSVHGWIYSIADGLIRDLEVTASRGADAERLG